MAAPGRQRRHLVLCALLAWPLLAGAPARAQVGSGRYSSVVVNASSGRVLESDDANARRHPASLAKLMTLYLTFEALRDRRITLDTPVAVSAHAASMEPTKLGLVPGSRLTVKQAILGLVTRSANDAACALGELLGGSESRFAQMMTLRARALGMNHTHFTNASGLPDPNEWTSASDMAILARHLLNDFPGDYHYFSVSSFVFRGHVIPNHDTMLKIYPGVDGLKTGYTDASGHNLVTSAVRDGVRLIGVIMGAASNHGRDRQMVALLNEGFQDMDVPLEGGGTKVAGRFHLISAAHAATPERRHAARTAERTRRKKPRKPLVREKAAAASTWGIQVGSFSRKRTARAVAVKARRRTDNGNAHLELVVLRHHRRFWRAQVVGLSAHEARKACHERARHKRGCIILRPDRPVVASR